MSWGMIIHANAAKSNPSTVKTITTVKSFEKLTRYKQIAQSPKRRHRTEHRTAFVFGLELGKVRPYNRTAAP